MAAGTIIAAPSYVLALLLDLPLWITILIIGSIATLYTMMGGITGVIKTDVKQMTIMIFGLIFSFAWILYLLPDEVGFDGALTLAGTLGKLKAFDTTFDVSEKYNVWSGVIAALFLMLSYFGTDQSQVQRYLTAKSLGDARNSLLLSAYAKVPMQFFILLLGVMLYVFYIFQASPVTFRAAEGAETNPQVTTEFQELHQVRKEAALAVVATPGVEVRDRFLDADKALNAIRDAEMERQEAALGSDRNDTNYIFPYFILEHIPIGVAGLLIAGIFAAALSSIDSELNALSTIFIVDWYRRLRGEGTGLEQHYLTSSRYTTLLFGVLATVAALALGETVSIIELVNKIGSYFYGSILGVFILLLWVKRANGSGAVAGLFSGMATVFFFDRIFWDISAEAYRFVGPLSEIPAGYTKAIEYLWLNPIGAATVVLVGVLISAIGRNS